VGVAVDKIFQGAGFIWTPYGSINAVRESGGGFDHAVDGGLLGTTSTDGTSALVELGIGARRDKLSISGGVNWTDGGALESVTGAQLVLRYSW
jgi:outer membrane autotransporter protein